MHRLFISLILLLATMEATLRLLPATISPSYLKPFSRTYDPNLVTGNQLGNIAQIDRENKIAKIGLFSNSVALGPEAELFLWQTQLAKAFPQFHFESYAAYGGHHEVMNELLDLAIRRKEKYDLLVVTTTLVAASVSPNDPEVSFKYSYRWRARDKGWSHLWYFIHKEIAETSFYKILTTKSFPAVGRWPSENITSDAPKAKRKADAKKNYAIINECYRKSQPLCHSRYTALRVILEGEKNPDAKNIAYNKTFRPCTKEIALACGVESTEATINSELVPEEIETVRKQIREIKGRADKLSKNILFIIAPVMSDPRVGIENLVTISTAYLVLDEKGNFIRYPDSAYILSMALKMRTYARALELEGMPFVNPNAEISQAAKSSLLFEDVAHLTKLGNTSFLKSIEPEVRDALKQMGGH